MTVKIGFGSISQSCQKLVQDISVYLQKCPAYCNSCPDGGIVLQYASTVCLKTCPQGYFISSDGTQC